MVARSAVSRERYVRPLREDHRGRYREDLLETERPAGGGLGPLGVPARFASVDGAGRDRCARRAFTRQGARRTASLTWTWPGHLRRSEPGSPADECRPGHAPVPCEPRQRVIYSSMGVPMSYRSILAFGLLVSMPVLQ